MTQDMICDMWSSCKQLQGFIEDVVSKPVHGVLKQLEEMLRNNKHFFVTLLSNPPKNAQYREEIKKSLADGTPLPLCRHHLLTKEIVDETLIISDMFSLDEYEAFDLLITAQNQMPFHPGLPRGLVAVLLYYDARKCLVSAMKSLMQARKGVAWTLHTSEEILQYVTWFTQDLVDHNLLSHIVDMVISLDLSKEIDLLHQNRALGGPHHHRQVVDLIQDTRRLLAEILYCWAAQCGLPRPTTLKLLNYMKTSKLEDDASGVMDAVSVTLTVSLLYALDLSVLHTKEDGEEVAKALPLLSDPDFMPALMKEFVPTEEPWITPGIQGLAHLAWALSLCALRLSRTLHTLAITDEDDLLIDSANELNVFDFMRRCFLPNKKIYSEEFFLRRLHILISDFIVYMPMKVKEMKNRSDEAARTIQAYMQEGLDPPQGLPHHFEHLLLVVARLYKQDPLKLQLSLEYWPPPEFFMKDRVPYRSPRQVALYKFVRLGGDMLPPAVFVPYMKMLRSLANGPEAARNCYNFLRSSNHSPATISWSHFFKSLERYYSNLRQELPPTTDTVYQPRSFPRGILPQEIQGLQAVLGVIRAVADNDPVSRVALTDSAQWSPINIMLGLVACSVPIPLKAELLLTLASLARSPGPATALWYALESSQILATIPSTSSYQARGIQTELEEIEARNEEFPLTRALLHLLDVLTDVPIPQLLGVEARSPGLDPYLNFIVNSVFLRFNTRSYKNPEEKWQIAQSCLNLLKKFVCQYTPSVCDFSVKHVDLQSGGRTVMNSTPGYHVMVNLNSKTELLRLILHLVDDGAHMLDTFSPMPGQRTFEASMLCALEVLEGAISRQDYFFELLNNSGSSLLIGGLRRLLLDVNPRSGKPDHLLNISKYIAFSSLFPRHALAAVKILFHVCATPSAQSHLLSLYTSSPYLTMGIRHGFVECLESEEDDPLPDGEEGATVQSTTKEAIFRLLQQCLHYTEPNISHFLFGFDLKKVTRTVFQQPGVLGFPRTCLHALLSILDVSLAKRETPYMSGPRGPLLETSYCMLYRLCSDGMTYRPVLRFLRSCGDFLLRHVAQLPFTGDNKTSDMTQMSWLLKIVAVELKVTSRNDQLSTLDSLVQLLTQEQGDALDDLDNQETFEDDNDENLSQYLSRKNDNDDLKTKKQRMLLTLLNVLDFQVIANPQPEWEFFVPKHIAELSSKCEVIGPYGQKFVDIKKMHHTMQEELSTLQTSTSTAQRSLVVGEIEKVLKFFINQNNQKTHCQAAYSYMDAWRQVAEILFCACPRTVLSEDMRLGLLVDSLHIVLKKVLSHQVIPELAALSSGVVLLLSVSLQQCLEMCLQQEMASLSSAAAATSDGTKHTPVASYSSLNIPGRPGIFDTVLSNILEWTLNSGVASQKLRMNLYGALLMFVRMVCRDTTQRRPDIETETSRIKDSLHVSQLDACTHRSPAPESQLRRQACLEIIMGFGEGLIDVLAQDCTGGQDVCKMLALSCLGLLVEFDPHSSWILHISARGYLRHIMDSLMESDEKLVSLLSSNVRSLSALYVYESKMAMLCRVAVSLKGAETILNQGIFGCLAAMTVFDKHPDLKPNLPSLDLNFIPTARSRFQQILFPALDLCDSALTTLGPDSQACCSQIQFFLYSHYEMLSIVLRRGSPLMQAKFLKELTRITGIIARVAHHDISKEIFREGQMGIQYSAHIQTWMLELVRHFLVSESVIRELRGTPAVKLPGIAGATSAANPELYRSDSVVLHFLRVACNLKLFACNIISRKGMNRETTRPLFSCKVEEFFTETEPQEGEEKKVTCPPLGLIVEQLVQCVSYHQREKSNLDLLQHKKMSVASSSTITIDLSELFTDSVKAGAHSAESHAHVCRTLDKLVQDKRQELEHCAFLIDNCLYLIWCHVDMYMYQASLLTQAKVSPPPPPPVTKSTTSEEPPMVSMEDINALKRGLVSTFNDTFSQQLIETQQEKSATDKGFIEALIKRIKRLIQFAPTDVKL